MHISKNGLNLIKKWEGCYLKAYQDCVGVWTIGYGITNADYTITHTRITKGLKITQKQADLWLYDCIVKLYEPKVLKYRAYHWTQNEFDALVSFAFNIGSIDSLTNNGKRTKAEIARAMLLYCKAGGKSVRGLYNRRVDEHKLFLKADGEYKEEKKEISYNMPVLTYGSELKAVRLWQFIVGAKVDGVFGNETEELTRNFQTKHGLNVDGVVGTYTWSAGIQSFS